MVVNTKIQGYYFFENDILRKLSVRKQCPNSRDQYVAQAGARAARCQQNVSFSCRQYTTNCTKNCTKTWRCTVTDLTDERSLTAHAINLAVISHVINTCTQSPGSPCQDGNYFYLTYKHIVYKERKFQGMPLVRAIVCSRFFCNCSVSVIHCTTNAVPKRTWLNWKDLNSSLTLADPHFMCMPVSPCYCMIAGMDACNIVIKNRRLRQISRTVRKQLQHAKTYARQQSLIGMML